MTHPSPLPPSGTQLGVSTVMAGQVLDRTDGAGTFVVLDDMVLLTLHEQGKQVSTAHMSPEQAMQTAAAIASAAGALISKEIDDTGNPTTLLHRLRRLGTL